MGSFVGQWTYVGCLQKLNLKILKRPIACGQIDLEMENLSSAGPIMCNLQNLFFLHSLVDSHQ